MCFLFSFEDSTKCPNSYVPNGYIDTYSCERNPGDICTYYCYSGFSASSHTLNSTDEGDMRQGTIKCNSSSMWEHPVSSFCVETRCPSTIANGSVSKNCTYLVNKRCEYFCNKGYDRVSVTNLLHCSPSGQWVLPGVLFQPQYVCVNESKLCPVNIQNGSLAIQDSSYNNVIACLRTEGSSCSYYCNTGCRSNPNSMFNLMRCSNQTWVLDDVQMTEQLCVDCLSCKPTIPGGIVWLQDGYADSNYTYACYDAYEKNSNITILKCSDKNEWIPSAIQVTFSGVNDFCIPKLCPGIPNGNVVKSDSCQMPSNGSVCRITCDGHYYSNITNITCQLQYLNGEKDMYWSSNGRRISPLTICTNDVQCPIHGIPHGTLYQTCKRNPADNCSFTCDVGYLTSTRSNNAFATCSYNPYTRSPKWNIPITSRCERIRCPETIPNGQIDSSCSRYVNNLCYDYRCNWGYKRSHNFYIKCNAVGEWEWDQFSVDDFCLSEDVLCPANIKNAQISVNCPRTEGSQCWYTCNAGCKYAYSLNVLTCKNRTWGRDTDTLCTDCNTRTTTRPVLCPSLIAHGYILSYCSRRPQSSCNYFCDYGCSKSFSSLTCSSYGDWFSDYAACTCPEKFTCPYSIPNGYIYGTCDYTAGSVCSVSCYSTCYNVRSTVYCDSTGQWSRNVCRCEHSTTEKPDDSRSISVFGITGIVLAICFIISVIAGCRFYNKRLMSNNRARNDESGSQRTIRNTDNIDRVSMSQIEVTSESRQPTFNNVFQGPPPYNEIAFTKPEAVEQPPSYEEVTAHPLSFSADYRATTL